MIRQLNGSLVTSRFGDVQCMEIGGPHWHGGSGAKRCVSQHKTEIEGEKASGRPYTSLWLEPIKTLSSLSYCLASHEFLLSQESLL